MLDGAIRRGGVLLNEWKDDHGNGEDLKSGRFERSKHKFEFGQVE